MEFYPDERYRHDKKHNNKCNANSKLECMKLENLLVCPKCHCVVLMKSDKMEYLYCHKCHDVLFIPLVYVITMYQNPMNFSMPFTPFMPMGAVGLTNSLQNANNQLSNQMVPYPNMDYWKPMMMDPGIFSFFTVPTSPFPLNINNANKANNGYVNNTYMPNNNYMNPFWFNTNPMNSNYSNEMYCNLNNCNDPNKNNSEKDPNKDNKKIKTPIASKRASELFE